VTVTVQRKTVTVIRLRRKTVTIHRRSGAA
jgi:hypothetical protein